MLLMLAALIAGSEPTLGAGAPRPVRPVASLVDYADYPVDAIRRGASGTVAVSIDVSAAGTPTRCTVTQAADPALDAATCEILMTRAHFEAGRNRRGEPIAGTFSSRIRWILPDDSGSGPRANLSALISNDDYPAGAIQRGASGTVGFKLDVGANGSPTNCTISQSADIELDRTTCDIMLARAHFQPATDSAGHATEGSISARVRWVLPDAETGLLPFASIHIAAVLTLDAQGVVTCSSTSNGAPPAPPPTQGECGEWYGTGAAEAMRIRAIPGDLILIFTMVPDGAVPAPGNEGAGAQLLHEDIAELVFNPEGRVSECRPAPTHAIQQEWDIGYPQPCWEIGEPVMVHANGQGLRRAEGAMRIYFRPRRAS